MLITWDVQIFFGLGGAGEGGSDATFWLQRLNVSDIAVAMLAKMLANFF